MQNKTARPGRTGLNNSESTDDYLKAILELSGPEDNPVSSNALAERLGIRAASVSGRAGNGSSISAVGLPQPSEASTAFSGSTPFSPSP